MRHYYVESVSGDRLVVEAATPRQARDRAREAGYACGALRPYRVDLWFLRPYVGLFRLLPVSPRGGATGGQSREREDLPVLAEILRERKSAGSETRGLPGAEHPSQGGVRLPRQRPLVGVERRRTLERRRG